jgi:dTMP kinase
VFIVFEGIDGSGKTTQAKMLVSNLLKMGINTIFTVEPSDGYYGQQIRQSDLRFPVIEEERLFREDRRDHLNRTILPILRSGSSVVCDRYIYSSVAYQGARGLNPHKILEANLEFAYLPDVTFILEIPVADAMKRIEKGRTSLTSFEVESELVKTSEIYSSFQDASIERVNADAPFGIVQGELINRLLKRNLLK